MKLLLDTDIGSDIDDAVCLAYLLAHPECELLGITTVSGEPERRASIASALCIAVGREVPIRPGASRPLVVPQRQVEAEQAAALRGTPHHTRFPAGEAIPFLRDAIRKYPGEITLLCIGPLTNIALLIRTDEEIATLLHSLVIMGGAYGPPGEPYPAGDAEWNLLLDPHAAAIVYDAPAPVHRSIGLNVTEQVRMDPAEVRQRFTTRRLRPVLDFAEVFFQGDSEMVFHDPLAAASIFDPGLCGFERGTVAIDLASGGSSFAPDAAGPHEVARSVDVPAFLDHYFAVAGRT